MGRLFHYLLGRLSPTFRPDGVVLSISIEPQSSHVAAMLFMQIQLLDFGKSQSAVLSCTLNFRVLWFGGSDPLSAGRWTTRGDTSIISV